MLKRMFDLGIGDGTGFKLGGKYGPRLFAGEGGGGGSGDGGGNGDGGGAGAAGAALTMADVNKAIAAQVNGAMKNWGERITKGLPTAEDINGIKAAIEALKSGSGASGGASNDNGNGGAANDNGGNGNGGSGGNGNPDVLELRKQLAKMKTDYDALAERDRQRSEREKAREAEIARREEDGALESVLRKHVRTEQVEGAVALLARRGVVTRDKDGKVAIKVKREWGDENVTVAEGVAEWLKTPEGKAYLPQVDAGGSGDKSGGKAPNAGDKGVVMDLSRAFSIALASGGGGEE